MLKEKLSKLEKTPRTKEDKTENGKEKKKSDDLFRRFHIWAMRGSETEPKHQTPTKPQRNNLRIFSWIEGCRFPEWKDPQTTQHNEWKSWIKREECNTGDRKRYQKVNWHSKVSRKKTKFHRKNQETEWHQAFKKKTGNDKSRDYLHSSERRS